MVGGLADHAVAAVHSEEWHALDLVGAGKLLAAHDARLDSEGAHCIAEGLGVDALARYPVNGGLLGVEIGFAQVDVIEYGLIQSGQIRALAVTTLKRTAALPDVPAVAELGFPGFEAISWHSFVAPAGTPKEIISKLHKALTDTLNDPDTRKKLTDIGIDPVGNTPDEFRAYVKADIPKWEKIISAAGIKAN